MRRLSRNKQKKFNHSVFHLSVPYAAVSIIYQPNHCPSLYCHLFLPFSLSLLCFCSLRFSIAHPSVLIPPSFTQHRRAEVGTGTLQRLTLLNVSGHGHDFAWRPPSIFFDLPLFNLVFSGIATTTVLVASSPHLTFITRECTSDSFGLFCVTFDFMCFFFFCFFYLTALAVMRSHLSLFRDDS